MKCGVESGAVRERDAYEGTEAWTELRAPAATMGSVEFEDFYGGGGSRG